MHISRRVAAATAAAALTLTAVTGTMVAAQAAAPSPAHATKPTKGVKPAKTTKVDRAVAKVTTTARILDKGLAAVAASRRLRGIETASAETITSNVAVDRAAIAAIVATVTADPTQALAAYATLKTYRTSNYTVAIGQVRSAELLLGQAATIADRIAVEAPDQQAAFDQALALLDGAHARALAVTATTPRAELDAISTDIETAGNLLDQVSAALAG